MSVLLVDLELIFMLVVCNKEIDLVVVVEICIGGFECWIEILFESGVEGHIFERVIVEVVKE